MDINVPHVPPVPEGTPACLHVGYHKCASTSLQDAFFAKHPQIRNLRGRAKEPRAAQAIEEIVAGHAHIDIARRKEGNLASAARLWRDAISDVRAAGQLPVYSWENLTRHFFFRTSTDERLPQALKAVVGDARIVIVIRNQMRLLESLYLSRVKPPSYRSPEEWLDDEGRSTAPAYYYADVIGSYQSVFGPENVLVLLFEEIASDPEAFAGRLCAHMGVDPALGVGLLRGPAMNSRPSSGALTYARIRRAILPDVSIGQVLPGALVKVGYKLLTKGRASEVAFPDQWLAELEEVYREQNRQLVERFELGLERYGYPL